MSLRRMVPVRLAVVLACAVLLSSAAPAFALEALSIYPAWVPKNTLPASAVATIRGIGFDPASTVAFDGVAATVTFVDSRTLTVQVPTSGTGKVARVVVTNPGGASDDLYPFIYTDKNIYVSESGNDSGNGSTPGTAKRTIRGGIDTASTTVTNLILVTGGRFGDNSLPVPTGTVVAGGYDAAFTARDPDLNITVVDSNKSAFNLRSFGLDAKIVVDGLTFTEGLRDGTSGGSIEFVGDQVVLSNSVIVGAATSSMGGGVYVGFSTAYGGRTSISNNVIIGNRSYAGAGAGIVVYPLYTQGNSLDVSISDNYIVGNRSFQSRGGGVAVQTNAFYGYNMLNLKMAGNTVMGNFSKAGAGVDLNLATQTDAVTLLMDNNLIADNDATGEGGGLTANGLGMLYGSVSSSTITANMAGAGAGAGININPSLELDPSFGMRDLIVWDNATNDTSGPNALSYSDVGDGAPGTGNITVNPLFVKGLRSRFYLDQNDPNSSTSPAVDAGSATAAANFNEALTTSPDGAPDTGVADMGMHYAPAPADSPDPIQIVRIDPGTGDTAGHDWVLIRGKGFDPGARVFFGTPEAVNTLYINSQRILAQPPPRGAITVDVTVTNPDASSAILDAAFRYLDNMPPIWQTTTGAQAATSPGDCVRSIIVDWNGAVDAASPPVKYEVYKFACDPAAAGATPPCLNYLDFIPTAANRVAITSELTYLDTAFTASGSDPKFLYIVRAVDSHNPQNRDLNLSKRLGTATKNTSDTTPPAPVGDTLQVSGSIVLDWAPSRGAAAYRVYRQTVASAYANPASLTPLVTLDKTNNDLDFDGFVDTMYTDPAVPAVNQIFNYKITALDPCNVETKTSDLLP